MTANAIKAAATKRNRSSHMAYLFCRFELNEPTFAKIAGKPFNQINVGGSG